jgi:hypothetical protein
MESSIAPSHATSQPNPTPKPPSTPHAEPGTSLAQHLLESTGIREGTMSCLFAKLADVVIQHLAEYLNNQTSFLLTHVSITSALYRLRLKPQCLVGTKVKPYHLYKEPGNRLDRFVPCGPAGQKAMQNLGIQHGYLINQIQEGRMAIAEAQQMIQSNRLKLQQWREEAQQVIDAAPSDYDDFDRRDASGMLMTLSYEPIQLYVECGLIASRDRYMGLKVDRREGVNPAYFEYFATKRTMIHDYLDKGKLTIDDMKYFDTVVEFGLILLATLKLDLRKWSREMIVKRVLPLTREQARAIDTQEKFDQLMDRPSSHSTDRAQADFPS